MDTTTPPAIRCGASRRSALAYDRRHANRRAAFALTHHLHPHAEGWRLRRHWQGIGGESLYIESVDWHPVHGLRCVEAESPSLGEHLSARAVDDTGSGSAFETQRVAARGARPQARILRPPQRAFTLASAPLEIAAAWPALKAGARVRRSFLVLKVQRHAAVDFSLHAQDDASVTVALTPVALPLRWWFGRTLFHFARPAFALTAIDGLLDPRDRKPNGRWHEYLGRLEFDPPLPLAALLPGHPP